MQFNEQRGVTLLETILALTIGVSLLTLGIKFYNQFQFQVNEQKIMSNVNQLFLGLEGFYYANCRQALDVNANSQSSGKLDPAVIDTSTPTGNVILGVMSDLVNPGFIPSANWRPNNPLLDNTPTPDQGYYVQFNRELNGGVDPAMSVSACTGASAPPSCDVTGGKILSSTTPPIESHAVTWVVQVTVKLSTSLTAAQWTQIQNDLNATTSSLGAGYLVWTRTPSYFNQNISSDYWTATPYVKEFNMQYTNDGMATLSGVKKETQNTTTSQNWYNPLYYLCGG